MKRHIRFETVPLVDRIGTRSHHLGYYCCISLPVADEDSPGLPGFSGSSLFEKKSQVTAVQPKESQLVQPRRGALLVARQFSHLPLRWDCLAGRASKAQPCDVPREARILAIAVREL